MVAEYEYVDFGNFNTSHSVMLMLHTLIANIFMINFLVAIISTVYFNMIEGGEFMYKALKFQFFQKYQIAMQQHKGLQALVSFPPPINVVTAPLIIFGLDKRRMQVMGEKIYNVAFWFENIFIIIPFLMYEFILIPIVYCKVFYFCAKMNGFFAFLQGIIVWVIIGIPFCFY